MPDWSYRTLFRPALFSLPSKVARDITLQAMGTLSKMPWGSLVIRTLGHMESYPILETNRWEMLLQYPVGLSGNLDIHGRAQAALAQFGFGFIEIGPVTLEEVTTDLPIQRDLTNEAILYPCSIVNDGVETIIRRVKKKQGHRKPLLFRTRHMPGKSAEEALSEHQSLLLKLSPFASGFYIDMIDDRWSMDRTTAFLQNLLQHARSQSIVKPMFLYVPLDYPMESLVLLLANLDLTGWAGIVIGDSIRSEQGYIVGREGKAHSIEKARYIREHTPKDWAIIATGGIHQPQDALDLLEVGTDYVQLHSGLVYSGPGLPKRINEAIIYERVRETDPAQLPSFWKSWGWMCLLGIGMMIGGIIAWFIAATSIVLPYDESFLQMKKTMLSQMNSHLLPFMSHDRITLAGTMISLGIMYFQLAQYGLRKGLHWAQTALLASGIVGFCSFFLYLGYGYFDPLHALAAVILLPMFVLAMRVKVNEPSRQQPNLYNDRKWLNAQWGQLLFVVLGFALAIGGVTISVVGITHIFVSTDLTYLHSTHDRIGNINSHLLPLIAHDRAGFGGALFSDAVVILATALWGINQGDRWMWWTLLAGGLPGFLAAFSVHIMIGYFDFWHLLPAYFAVVVYIVGLILLYPYLHKERKKTALAYDL
ncbi:MAG: hypothetical protein JWM44_999 [Bacilli bacterium]|nr:hypothetical protein [Bacilli bacterium]